MFTEKKVLNLRERSDQHDSDLRPRDRMLQRREDRIERRNLRQNNRAEEQLARIDNIQEERALDRQNDAEEANLRELQRIERREARRQRRNPELQALQTEVQRTQEEQRTVEQTRTQIRDIDTPPRDISQVQREPRPAVRAEQESRIPADNPRAEIVREYRLKVEEHMGGFLGGIFNFLGINSEEVAIQLAADGENLENISFFTVFAAAAGLGLNKIINRDAIAEVSDIEVTDEGSRIEFRKMDSAEWDNLTDDPEDRTFTENYTNLEADSRLNIRDTHEVFLAAGTKINNLSRDLIVTRVSDNVKTRITAGAEYTVPEGGIVIRDTISTDTNETYTNYIPSGTKFLGTLTLRPIDSSVGNSSNISILQENQLAEYTQERVAERSANPDAFIFANAATVSSLNFTLNINFDEHRSGILRGRDYYQAILTAVTNDINNSQASRFGLETENFTDSVKAMLAAEIASAIAANYIPANNNVTGTRRIQVTLNKNQLSSRTEEKLLYSVNT